MTADQSQGQVAVRPPMFGAILAPVRRRRWPWVTLVLAMALAGVGLAVHRTAGVTNVITPLGLRTVRRGMTTREVNSLLGKPFDVKREPDGADCFKYGHPSVQVQSFVVYSVCYLEGRLRDVTQHQYTASTVAPDGVPSDLAAPPDPAPAPTPGQTPAPSPSGG